MKRHIFLTILIVIIVLAIIKSTIVTQAESEMKKQTSITLRVTGNKSPFVNFEDGHKLPTIYRKATEIGQNTESRAIATADFDEDGVADLVCGYAITSGGVLSFQRGNVDAIYPNSPEAKQRKQNGQFTNEPFLTTADTFIIPVSADFLGAGDFDADGHWDLVSAEAGDHALYFLRGDGKGNFKDAQRLELQGKVTALISGEINRADGLTDVIVGINGADGAKVLVFESPTGALNQTIPESFALPAEATSFAIGQLDEKNTLDLAVAAGNKLVIVHGRDRKLSTKINESQEIVPAVIDEQTFSFDISSLVIGEFDSKNLEDKEIALLANDGTLHFATQAAKSGWELSEVLNIANEENSFSGKGFLVKTESSAVSGSELIVIDSSRNVLQVIAKNEESKYFVAAQVENADATVAILPMRLNVDALDDLMILNKNNSAPSVLLTAVPQAAVVTNTNDSGTGSFRNALSSGSGLISFNIPGAGPHTINILSDLPEIIGGSVIIDGTTQPGFAGTPIIVLNGQRQPGISGLSFQNDLNVVRGLAIINFNSPGINFGTTANSGDTYDNNIVEGNYIGVGANGTGSSTTTGNIGTGIVLRRANNTLIGGTVSAARNVIAANTLQIVIADSAGLLTLTGNVIRGNYIGTNANGTQLLVANNAGIQSGARLQTTVGGTMAGARNIIASNSGAVTLGGRTNNLVQGNYIGTDVSGTVAINSSGAIGVTVALCESQDIIGGTTPAARNIISGGAIGVNLGGNCSTDISDGVLVQGNFIGTQVDGLSPLPTGIGVRSESPFPLTSATIGGTTSNAANVIAYNRQYGIALVGVSSDTQGGTTILGNSIHSNIISPGGTGLGIDILTNGVTPNDNGDADQGPNGVQNYPVLSSAHTANGNTTIQYSLNSNPNSTFRIEFFSNPTCDPSNYGEGKTFLGAVNVATNVSGNVVSSAVLSVRAHVGNFITATASTISGNRPLLTSEFSQCVHATGTSANKTSDFDGDGKSDIAIFRPVSGDWWILRSRDNSTTVARFGSMGDIPTPGDYDADGLTDFSVYRPSSNDWYINYQATGDVLRMVLGVSADKPVAADYDGDGKADLAVYRPVNGLWTALQSSNAATSQQFFGISEDKPVPGDYDGDGRADLAVFRPSNGTWYVYQSTTNSMVTQRFGTSEDKPVPADYNGDGFTDIAVFRPSDGVWYFLLSPNNVFQAFRFGINTDRPVPADYDGDDKADITVYRNGIWYLQRTTEGFAVMSFGLASDIPIPAGYVP